MRVFGIAFLSVRLTGAGVPLMGQQPEGLVADCLLSTFFTPFVLGPLHIDQICISPVHSPCFSLAVTGEATSFRRVNICSLTPWDCLGVHSHPCRHFASLDILAGT